MLELDPDWDEWYFQAATAFFLISSPQVKTLMHIDINAELMIKLVASKLKMWVEAYL